MSTLKSRHYAALSSSLRQLQQDLGESEIQMVRLAEHLESMQQMGTYSAAQFMAVSRLLDKDLNEAEQEDAPTPQQSETGDKEQQR